MEYGWRLSRGYWQELDEHIRGLTWFFLPFDNVHVRSVPEKPGVYLICARPPIIAHDPHKRFFNVLYAGRSESSLRDRFKKHCENPDKGIAKVIACYGFHRDELHYYYATAKREDVVAIEDSLIDCYGPSANLRSGDKFKIKAHIRADKARPAG